MRQEVTLKILSILSSRIRFFWSSFVTVIWQTSESIKNRPKPSTLTSMCFSSGRRYIRVSSIWTAKLMTSASNSSYLNHHTHEDRTKAKQLKSIQKTYAGIFSRASLRESRILFCVAKNMDKFCDSCNAFWSVITFKN